MIELEIGSRQTISTWEKADSIPRLVELAITALDQVEASRKRSGFERPCAARAAEAIRCRRRALGGLVRLSAYRCSQPVPPSTLCGSGLLVAADCADWCSNCIHRRCLGICRISEVVPLKATLRSLQRPTLRRRSPFRVSQRLTITRSSLAQLPTYLTIRPRLDKRYMTRRSSCS
jgi:hypothetical protein